LVEAVQGFGYIAGHGHINGTIFVVPMKSQRGAGPVSSYVVNLLESFKEVLGMFAAHLFDTKVIDHKGENDRPGDVSVRSWCIGKLVVPTGDQVGLEAVIGNDTGLWEPIHVFANLDQHLIVMDEGAKL
jgi:hypothetical protein